MKIKIKAKLEILDHEVWCSDNECKYNSFINKYIIHVPSDNKYYNNYDFTKLLPIPNINYGSDYCDLSNNCSKQFWVCNSNAAHLNCTLPNCKKYNLERHEYKYTILSVSYNVEL